MSTEHPFHDPLSHRMVTLVVSDDQNQTGVKHDHIEWTDQGVFKEGCTQLAHVTPQLDSAFCTTCHWQCRISGYWYVDMVNAWAGRG